MVNSVDNYYLCGRLAAESRSNLTKYAKLMSKFYNALLLESDEHKASALKAFESGYKVV
jgi:hypothetical protein